MDYQQVAKQLEASSQEIIRHVDIFLQQIAKYLSNRSNVETVGKITAISVATYVVADRLYQGFFGPLSSLPGPFWSKFIAFPRFLFNRPRGTSYQRVLSLHDKYGEVVRLGPTFVSIADKDMLKQILVTEDFPKAKIYDAFQKKGDHTLFSTTDAVWHKKRRRLVSPAFSIKYLNSMEPFMAKVAESLVHKIDSEIVLQGDKDSYASVDIWGLAQRLALDVIGETAFGQTFNMVENNDHFVPGAITDEMRATAVSVLYPLLAKLFLKNGGEPDPQLRKFMTDIIQDRLKNSKGEAEQRKDILQFLINVQQTAEADDSLTVDSIISETTLFLIAGSETTSNSIGFAFIHLLQNPDKLKMLYQELDTVDFEPGQVVLHHDQIKHLPYLNAVINETLRMDNVAAAGIFRRVPKDTLLDGRVFVPKDTTLGCNILHAQINSKYWPHPHKFQPERWLEGNQNKSEASDLEAFYSFSVGTRNCIGKNFALQEMRLVIATLLKTYEIQPIEEEMKEAKERRHFITLTVPSCKFNIKIRRRE
ncbi:cytochrome P450 CYP5313 [Mucor lusitanicus]|uniref:Cytochrome P450 CYP5313 n=2 Tax=Mucor circinelloides f. lusitanicus TaxID=29924 RepID=A0A162QWD1_MUCCL|nr:cytochrome P450 CYP5313 [Mucor lusitanicus]OAD06230.1 cytochrome P450 CYP5313 [Mucor lusitanicus CBS 277.49]